MGDDIRIRGDSAATIVASVRDLVAATVLRPGDELPTIRALAAELGVNRNTVAAAYQQLVASGAAQTAGRRGTFIASAPDIVREGFSQPDRSRDLGSGNPDPRLLPDVLAALRDLDYEPSLYGSAPVEPALGRWVREHAADEIGAPFQVTVTHGAMDAVERLLAAHLARGDAIALEDPCFIASIGAVQLSGYRSAPVPVDDEGMTPQGLESALRDGARAVLLTPRAHNPTGAALSAARAQALQEVLERHPHVLVIEDDYYSALSVAPYHRATPPEAANWALVRSVSKFLGPDLRVALVLSDADTAQRLGARFAASNAWVSHLLQRAVLRLLEVGAGADGAPVGFLATARDTYAQRRRQFVADLAAVGVEVPGPTDSMNVWVPVPADAETIAAGLQALGWIVRPGSVFSSSGAKHLGLRCTVAALDGERSAAFAKDLATVLREVR
ncbi:aminotransferase class I/II-fold pyridoxal phosphate-dependent enzyme [Xylanimonas ulmi]|uniref:DNA-binding transcriptional MocR family regulator n=1 Tax=Xylanimonas ulmi TaxID=228973 RepID=A0A4Q7M2K3_9MICO|nr:aminotransferase class I/II-fold pyridoxal phosphate-dependent enzyme [Xylanibacterium ulmi]RZS61193.1 DNA-binding transcriptional MocR family regulator [Xylanibacterium ulmi]